MFNSRLNPEWIDTVVINDDIFQNEDSSVIDSQVVEVVMDTTILNADYLLIN